MTDMTKLIKLLSSDKDGEILAAVAAIKRQLKSNGKDIHDLAKSFGGNGYSYSNDILQQMARTLDANRHMDAFESGRRQGRQEAKAEYEAGVNAERQSYLKGYSDGWKKGRAEIKVKTPEGSAELPKKRPDGTGAGG